MTERVEAAFRSVPFVVDVDNSYGERARRLRAVVSTDDTDFYRVQEFGRLRHPGDPRR